jgi:3-methyladenine DNA glycosylase AlkC
MVMSNVKDMFSKDVYVDLAAKISAVYPPFSAEAFVHGIFTGEWPDMELFQRLRHSAKTLTGYLPDAYETSLDLIEQIIPALSMAQGMIFPEYIIYKGLDDLETSIRAFEMITPFSSCEFAVRPFIDRYEQDMLDRMMLWTKNSNEHIRRLASEGTRISIPWGAKVRFVETHPQCVLPLLNTLMEDPSEYVRTSVANNLNELSKAAPEMMLGFCRQWLGKSKETDKLIKHACRTLIKKGNDTAMGLFGLAGPEGISVESFAVDQAVSIGEPLTFRFDIRNTSEKEQKIRIGYDLGFPGANNKTNYKASRISERVSSPGAFTIERKHVLKETSSRKLKEGRHEIRITINGTVMVAGSFMLKAE